MHSVRPLVPHATAFPSLKSLRLTMMLYAAPPFYGIQLWVDSSLGDDADVEIMSRPHRRARHESGRKLKLTHVKDFKLDPKRFK